MVLLAVGGGGGSVTEMNVHILITYAYYTNKISVDQCHLSAAGMYGMV